jgi:hypothetical protein
MTEAEWLTCTDPAPMLEFLRGKASNRKLRLFAVACCRHIWHLLGDWRVTEAVEKAEQYADKASALQELRIAYDNAEVACIEAYHAVHDPEGREATTWKIPPSFFDITMDACAAATAASHAANPHNTSALEGAARYAREALARCDDSKRQSSMKDEQVAQADLFRDIFGNPSRPVPVNPAWQTNNVLALAQTIYDDRAFDRLPILADALEDAGCDNADILNHCRQPGEHVRGCWAVDLLLGKS